MRTALTYIAAAGAIGLTLVMLVRYLEPHLAFYPTRGEDATPAALKIPYESIAVATSDGEKLTAWLLSQDAKRGAGSGERETDRGKRGVEVVFWHGNGGNLSNWLDIIAGMWQQGFTVLAFDYRGYGTSTGRPTEAGLYRDTDAVLETFWRQVHRPGACVIYWGRSLGGTLAAYGSKGTDGRRPDGVILESPYPDKASVIADNLLLGTLNHLAAYRFPTSAFLRASHAPLLIVHGDRDEVIAYRLGQRVFEEASGRKTFVTIAGARHNDLHLVDPRTYWRAINDFARQVCVG